MKWQAAKNSQEKLESLLSNLLLMNHRRPPSTLMFRRSSAPEDCGSNGRERSSLPAGVNDFSFPRSAWERSFRSSESYSTFSTLTVFVVPFDIKGIPAVKTT